LNAKKAKEIRRIIGYNPREKDETLRRVYRRARTEYSKLSGDAGREFLNLLKELYSSNNKPGEL
jgi:hypothetical protein